MSAALLSDLSIFVLSLLVGFEVISKVPATLHTPLMSGANSIHGVVLVGAILAASTAHDPLGYVLAFIARGLRRGQRGRWLRRHRPDAADVPSPADAGADADRRTAAEDASHEHLRHRRSACAYLSRRSLLRPRPAPDELARRPPDAATRSPRPGMTLAIVVTRGVRRASGHDHRRRMGGCVAAGILVGARARPDRRPHGPDDRHAAAGQPVQRGRRWRGRAGRDRRVRPRRRRTHSLELSTRTTVATVLDVIIGAVTFSGSLIAAGKLQGVVTGAPGDRSRRSGCSTRCSRSARVGGGALPDLG